MRNHVKNFKNGLSSDAFAHQGPQITMYDKNGRPIVGQENIKAEVELRTRAWIAEYGSEPLSTHNINDVHIDMSGSMQTTIRDIEGNDADKILGIPGQDSYPQITDQDSSRMTDKIGNKRQHPNTENYEGSKVVKRDGDVDVNKLSRDELISLNERATAELKNREEGNKVSEARADLDNFQVSNPTTTNNDNKNSNAGGVIAAAGAISAFAIGSVVFLKNKLGKNKKK